MYNFNFSWIWSIWNSSRYPSSVSPLCSLSSRTNSHLAVAAHPSIRNGRSLLCIRIINLKSRRPEGEKLDAKVLTRDNVQTMCHKHRKGLKLLSLHREWKWLIREIVLKQWPRKILLKPIRLHQKLTCWNLRSLGSSVWRRRKILVKIVSKVFSIL